MNLHRSLRILVLSLVVLPLTGCLFRSHEERRPISTTPLREASAEQLIEFINTNAARLQSFKADVDYNLTVSKQKKGKTNEFKVTEYTEVSGSLLVRKPEMLRMRGLVPAVHSTAFDMVGDAKGFSLSVPPKGKFFIGSNRVLKPSIQLLENIRPPAIFDALLIKEIDPQHEIAVLKQGMEIVKDLKNHKDLQQQDYEILVLRDEGKGWFLSREIMFSRVDLLPDRQIIYNPQGVAVTDASYENFSDHGGIYFPEVVHIDRPVEGYSIQVKFTSLNLNQPLRDDQFVLTQPPGYKVVNLDQANGDSAALNGQAAEETNPKPMH